MQGNTSCITDEIPYELSRIRVDARISLWDCRGKKTLLRRMLPLFLPCQMAAVWKFKKQKQTEK